MSDDNNTPEHNQISSLLIQDEMRECYLDYAMSVIVGRASSRCS
jgi:DNA gyrase subunit A